MTKVANLCIQCTTPDGSQEGSFLYFGEAGQPYAERILASPVFSDLVRLFDWAAANGWEEMPRDKNWPVGRYGLKTD